MITSPGRQCTDFSLCGHSLFIICLAPNVTGVHKYNLFTGKDHTDSPPPSGVDVAQGVAENTVSKLSFFTFTSFPQLVIHIKLCVHI